MRDALLLIKNVRFKEEKDADDNKITISLLCYLSWNSAQSMLSINLWFQTYMYFIALLIASFVARKVKRK